MPAPTPPLHLPADLPQPGPRRLALHVSPAAEKALRQGHPWLYAESIRRQSHDGQPGDLAVIYDGKERFLGIGLYDPASPLRVKLLQHGQPARIDADWFAAQVQQAAARRAPLAAQGTTGCRLIHGENDGLPGLVVDRYGATLVLKLYAAVWPPHLRALLPALVALPGVERVVLRLNRQLQAGEAAGLRDATTLAGTPPAGPVLFTENGLTFAVDVLRGHKTGFFCDQRDNRAQVRALAAGRQVLDVFAYVGAFAL
nr:class I SAM-dependent rRNA methyltransferase [Anaerolineae bacterium]